MNYFAVVNIVEGAALFICKLLYGTAVAQQHYSSVGPPLPVRL